MDWIELMCFRFAILQHNDILFCECFWLDKLEHNFKQTFNFLLKTLKTKNFLLPIENLYLFGYETSFYVWIIRKFVFVITQHV